MVPVLIYALGYVTVHCQKIFIQIQKLLPKNKNFINKMVFFARHKFYELHLT